MNKYKIYTFSVVRSTTPAFLDRLPYLCAVLQAPDGARFAALVEGYRDGMEVHVDDAVRSVGKDERGKERYALA
ncbi:MAG TPA: hypothetical protein PK597_04060 [Oscillospiraceae bacterium]|nr:hypothetical protein [Oscillospiraceae bacterium]